MSDNTFNESLLQELQNFPAERLVDAVETLGNRLRIIANHLDDIRDKLDDIGINQVEENKHLCREIRAIEGQLRNLR